MAAIQDFTTRLAGLRGIAGAGSEPARARVQIISDGKVAGSRDLEDGEYRIGARADCDLVVPDAHFPHIALLKVSNSSTNEGRLTLVPFIPSVTLDGDTLPAFAAAEITTTATVAVGPTLLRLTPGGRPAKTTPEPAPAVVRRAVAASARTFSLSSIDPSKLILAAGLLGAAALVSTLRDDPGLSFGRGAGDPVAVADAGPKIADSGDMLKLVRQQLAVADLSDALTARADGKAILIEGSVTDRQEDRFRTILAALRRKTSVELRSQVKPVALPAQSQIAGIALAPVAMVVMQDGGRYQVGDTLPKGWRVESISTQGVVLTRDSLRETIPLGAR